MHSSNPINESLDFFCNIFTIVNRMKHFFDEKTKKNRKTIFHLQFDSS